MAIQKKTGGGRHFGLKLISIALAVLLELYFYSPDNSVTLMVPATIEVRSLPPSTMIIDPPRGEKGIPAQIEVRGPRPLVEQLRNSFNQLTVDYPPQAPAQYTAVIDPNQLQLPSGVEVLTVNPTTVTIRIEPVVGKQLGVVVDQIGEPAAGYEIQSVEVFPETVVVRGPASMLEQIPQIKTRPLDISGVNESIRKEVLLNTSSPLITTGVTMVTVSVKVAPITSERTIESKRVEASVPSGYAAIVEPSRAAVVVKGPAHVMNKFDPESVTLQVDAAKLREGKHTLPVQAKLPAGIELVKTDPQTVQVTLVGRE